MRPVASTTKVTLQEAAELLLYDPKENRPCSYDDASPPRPVHTPVSLANI